MKNVDPINASFDALIKVEREAVARALKIIPVPDEFGTFRGISFNEMLRELEASSVDGAHARTLLVAILTALEAIGAIRPVVSPISSTPNFEDCTIYASTESAAYFIRALSRLLPSTDFAKSPIQATSSRTFGGLFDETIDPHLLMANLLERYRTDINRDEPDREPLRHRRIISVLLKGQIKKGSGKAGDVYLHTYKPRWQKYALIGSKQKSGETDLQTAMRAILEDLDTPPECFTLLPSGVQDKHNQYVAPTRGVFTDYSFNLVVATNVTRPIVVRQNLDYAWFTAEEILDQKSKDGLQIMTNPELIKDLVRDWPGGLESVQPLAHEASARPVRRISIRAQIRIIFDEVGRRLRTKYMRFYPWILLLGLGAATAGILFFTPHTNLDPYWANVLTIVGVLLALGSVIGLILSVFRASRNS